ncbi:MAG: hypothetical protein RR197_03825, partial [Oscillospiraceae bacterium]
RDWSDTVASLSLSVTGSREPRVPVRTLWPLGAYLTPEESAVCTLSLAVEPFLYAPVSAGQRVGFASLQLDGQPLASVLLVAAQDRPARFPEDRSILQRIKDFFERPEHWRFPLNERENGSLAPS